MAAGFWRWRHVDVGARRVVASALLFASLAHIMLDEPQDAGKARHVVRQVELRVQTKLAVEVVEAHAGRAARRLHAQRKKVVGVRRVAHQECARWTVLERDQRLLAAQRLVVPAKCKKPTRQSVPPTKNAF